MNNNRKDTLVRATFRRLFNVQHGIIIHNIVFDPNTKEEIGWGWTCVDGNGAISYTIADRECNGFAPGLYDIFQSNNCQLVTFNRRIH